MDHLQEDTDRAERENGASMMISIVVPLFKVEPYLRQCLDSILRQTYRSLEILLIDDGSPDECGQICEEYKRRDSRIAVIHTENKGLSAARNVGRKAATGNFIGFVDSDDWIEPDMYEKLLHRIEETNADISACGFWIELGEHQIERQLDETVYSVADKMHALLYEKIPNNVWNKLYRRELFQDLYFPEGMNYEDVAIMHRIVDRAGKIATIGEVKYHYRVRSDSISKTYTAKNMLDYADAHLERYHFFKDEKADQFADDAIQMIAAKGISKVWRWWYGCTSDEKQKYTEKIYVLTQFSRDNFPLFGYPSWPKYLRLSAVFMHSNSDLAFMMLYILNQMYRKLFPKKGNLI